MAIVQLRARRFWLWLKKSAHAMQESITVDDHEKDEGGEPGGHLAAH